VIALGIETSCDDTGLALVEDGRKVLAALVKRQILEHRKFGGVVPEIASRKHLEIINAGLEELLDKAGMSMDEVDRIGVTRGPGLMGSLLVGVTAGRTLGLIYGKPVYGINHLDSHIYVNFIIHPGLRPPFMSLVASGGHCELFYFRDYGKYELLGSTADDAPGEAFDKAAKLLGLPYPGGPEIEKLARRGNPEAFAFTIPRFKEKSLNFSFSGIKTSVACLVKDKRFTLSEKRDLAASFQRSVIRMLAANAFRGCEIKKSDRLVLAGGVVSNRVLAEHFRREGERRGVSVFYPPRELCMDNGIMTAERLFFPGIRKGDFRIEPDLMIAPAGNG